MDYVILTDSSCDLKKEVREEYGIELIPGHFTAPDKTDRISDLEWHDTTAEEFYQELKAHPDGYTSAPPNVQEWYEKFKEFTDAGKAVLAITISSGISGSFSFMSLGRDKLLEENPQAKIVLVDSMRYSAAIGLMAIYASNLRAQGKSIDEAGQWLNENKNCFRECGWLDDLSFVAKKGRISHATAFFGTLIGVKPIGEFDENGLTTVLGKSKGEKQAYKVFMRYMEETGGDFSDKTVFIAHSNRKKQALAYMDMIKEKFNPAKIYFTEVYPSCGINIGPGLMTAFYMGTPISKGLEFEKELVTKLIAEK